MTKYNIFCHFLIKNKELKGSILSAPVLWKRIDITIIVNSGSFGQFDNIILSHFSRGERRRLGVPLADVSVKNTIHYYDVNSSGYAVSINSNGGEYSFKGGYITGGNALASGGCIYQSGGKLTMNGGAIIGNRSVHYGGGICQSGGELIINGGESVTISAKPTGGEEPYNVSFYYKRS